MKSQLLLFFVLEPMKHSNSVGILFLVVKPSHKVCHDELSADLLAEGFNSEYDHIGVVVLNGEEGTYLHM